MIAWSKGLGKRELNINFAKCDVTLGEGNVYVKGKLYPTLWDCRVTFTPDDVPGLLNMILSRPVLVLFATNPISFFTFFVNRFILRRMGMKPSKRSGS